MLTLASWKVKKTICTDSYDFCKKNLLLSHCYLNQIWQIENFQYLKPQSYPNFHEIYPRLLIAHLVHHKCIRNRGLIPSKKQKLENLNCFIIVLNHYIRVLLTLKDWNCKFTINPAGAVMTHVLYALFE